MAKTCKKYIRKVLNDSVQEILKNQANIMYIIIEGEFVKFVFIKGNPKYADAAMRDIYRVLNKKLFKKAKNSCFVNINCIIKSFPYKQNLKLVMTDLYEVEVTKRKIKRLKININK